MYDYGSLKHFRTQSRVHNIYTCIIEKFIDLTIVGKL